MDDFLELGIEGVDKLVDKHFDKLPSKYTDPHTYSGHRHRHGDGERGAGDESVSRDGRGDSRRDSRDEDDAYNPGQSNNPRRRQTTDPYPSTSSRGGYDYDYPPPRLSPGPQEYRGRPRREGLVRRSSSQPGVYRDDDRESERDGRRRRNSISDEKQRSVGGAGSSTSDKVMLGLLGLAAGGLAVSVVMDMRDKKGGKGDDMRNDGRVRTGDGGRTDRDERRMGGGARGGGRR